MKFKIRKKTMSNDDNLLPLVNIIFLLLIIKIFFFFDKKTLFCFIKKNKQIGITKKVDNHDLAIKL